MECFSLWIKAMRPNITSVIEYTHRFVSLVSWNSGLEILSNVVFDNSLPSISSLALRKRRWVQISLWNITIVAWDMISSLS